MMKASELKIKADAAPDAVVLAPGHDHSYRDVEVELTTALYHPQHGWTEDHGEELTPEAEWGRRRQVMVIR